MPDKGPLLRRLFDDLIHRDAAGVPSDIFESCGSARNSLQ